MKKFTLNREDAVLVIVDIQERLAAVMDKRDMVIDNTIHLIEAAKLLNLPILVTEQYPTGLGPTVEKIAGALPPTVKPVEKISFSCCGQPEFVHGVGDTGKKQVILCGMETHVCVLQTALSLLEAGYVVHMVKDAVCSRKKSDFIAGVELSREAGAVITTTEIALFQLLKRAGTDEFKTIVKRIK